MKNLKIYLMLFLMSVGMIVFNSCSKDNELIKTNNIDYNVNGIAVIDGTLHFRNSDAFFKTTDLLAQMSEKELDQWEKSLGFISLRSEIDLVFNLLDNAKNKNEYDSIIISNQDIITIKDNTVQPLNNNGCYPMIINRKGFYFSNEVVHKVTPTKIIASLDGKTKTVNKGQLENIFNEAEGVFCSNYVFEKKLKSSNPTHTHGASSCITNQKYCEATCQAIREITYGDFNRFTWRVRIKIFSEAYVERGWPFNGYKLYNSGHECWDINYNIMLPDYSTGEFQWSNYSGEISQAGLSADMKTCTWLNISIGDIVRNIHLDVDYDNFYGVFQTRGSTPCNAIINF